MSSQSQQYFDRAQKVIPGGVNSPVRAFTSVGGTPVYIQSGKGTWLEDVDGNSYLDFCSAWGPLILGHAHPKVVEAIMRAAALGTAFGANTPAEVELAEFICRQIPYLEQIRLVNSGTEAVMTALRLARGVTGRNKIVKFEGCYHGHTDAMLVSAGSGLLTGGISSSAGVSAQTAGEVFVVPYNNLKALEDLLSAHGPDIAAVIVEPMVGNMGLVLPHPGYLEGLRAATQKAGSLLIFDEVITGFRLGPTSYGMLCGVTPDLTCLGKIIGGGLPIGALGGTKSIMENLAPLGKVYQAGTLSGNPVAVAAGLTTLSLLKEENPYPRMAKLGDQMALALNDVLGARGIPAHVAQKGSLFTVFFTTKPVHNLVDAKTADTQRYAKWFHGLLQTGIYFPPAQFETAFLSAAHREDDVERLIEAAEKMDL